MDKKKYFINLGSQEISQIQFDNNDTFTIYADDAEVEILRSKLDNMNSADFRTFVRSHVPIVPYHNDKSNHDYDDGATEAFQIIYDLGDEKTKGHVDSMGILRDEHK